MSKGKIAELEKLHCSLRDKRQADRVKAVIALSRGWSAAQVAEILLFDEKTSRHYFERYQQGGLQALLDDNYSGAEPKLGEHQISELDGYLEEHILPDAKSVIAHIYQQYGVRYSVSGVTDLLHRLGFSYKKPTHVPGKQDPAQQQAFLVQDEWQQKGMGSFLLDYLAQIAIQRGVKRFYAKVLPANKPMLAVFYNSGYKVNTEFDGEVYSISYDLTQKEQE